MTILRKISRKLTTPRLICLSILLHLLLLLRVNYIVPVSPPKQSEESYYYYQPAYAASKSSPAPTSAAEEPKKLTQADSIKSQMIENVMKTKAQQLSRNYQLSDFEPQQEQYSERLMMVGNKLLDDPLWKLLGRAISAHLSYPEIAKDLHLRGIVGISFDIHPEGQITDVKLLKTSKERILDVAALEAVKQASPVDNLDVYIKEPKHLEVNIIF